VVIGTDCIDSCKSNYHTITAIFPKFHYIVLNIIYICVCAIFVDIILCVLFVGKLVFVACLLNMKHEVVRKKTGWIIPV
jgi:hypothetical protein